MDENILIPGQNLPPRWPWRGMVGGLVIVCGILFFWWRSQSRGEGMAKKSETSGQTANSGAAATASAANVTSTGSSAAIRSAGVVLSELKKTYRPGGVPARIRLQGELSDRWEKQPPGATELIGQIADTTAPAEHRVYIAHSFRNLAKMNRLEAKEAAEVVDRMLEVVGDKNDDPLVRGQLAVVVAGFDKSSEAVRTVAPLLDNASDDVGALAVTALRYTATDEAANVLYDYLKRDEANHDKKPRTTASALLALTGYGKVDVVPLAKEIVAQTKSFELFQGALVGLSKTKSAVAVVEAILYAYSQAERFGRSDSIRLSEASLRALRGHSQFVTTQISTALEPKNPIMLRANELITTPRK